MSDIAMYAVLAVAGIHVLFGFLEMFRWDWAAKRLFEKPTAEWIDGTRVMAANQGVYNLMLAAGLIYAALFCAEACQRDVAMVLLVFIIVVGLYGGATVKKTIALAQSIPAAIALALLLST